MVYEPRGLSSQPFLSSRLSRHVGSLNNARLLQCVDPSDFNVGVEALKSVSATLNSTLRELTWRVPKLAAVMSGGTQVSKTQWSEVVFPSRLRKLTLTVEMRLSESDAAHLLKAIALLIHLRHLSFTNSSCTNVFDFTPLVALHQLECFELVRSEHSDSYFDEQIQQLRLIAAVRENGSALQEIQLSPADGRELIRLLAPNHQMALTTVTIPTFDSGLSTMESNLLAPYLVCLSASLTSLSVVVPATCTRLDGLSELTALRTLSLSMRDVRPSFNVTAAIHSLPTSLTSLSLSRSHSRVLLRLLIPLKSLTDLSLTHLSALESLACFPFLAHFRSTLRTLVIDNCSQLSGHDLSYLHGMNAMSDFTVRLHSTRGLTSAQRALYSPPCEHMPSLRSFQYSSYSYEPVL